MFRYTLNPCSCQWEIQLLRWGFFWITLRGIAFESLETAVAYAGASGISIPDKEQVPLNHRPVTAEQENPQ